MNLSNPIRPGSITTDDLHDGAVTSVKTDFSGSPLTYTPGNSLIIATSSDNTNTSTPILTISTPNVGGLANAVLEFDVGSSKVATFRASQSNNLIISANSTGALYLNFDSGSGGVNFCNGNHSVVATITSSGAISANSLTLTTALPVTSGGTGKTAPALVAGDNITITGTWPDNTVAVVVSPSFTTIDVTPTTDAFGIELHGNTVTPVSPAYLLHDDTGNALRGALGLAEAATSWSTSAAAGDIVLRADTGTLRLATSSLDALRVDQSQNVTLVKPLPVSSGGSGTATPALIEGSNITITGSWPDSTIAVDTTPSFNTVDAVPTTNAVGFKVHGNTTTPINPGFLLYDDTGSALRGAIGLAEASGNWCSGTASGDVVLVAETGTLYLATGGIYSLKVDESQNISIANKITSYDGMTTAGVGVPVIIDVGTATGITSSSGDFASVTLPALAVYRVSVYVRVTSAGTNANSVSIGFIDGFTGLAAGIAIITLTSPSSGDLGTGVGVVSAETSLNLSIILGPSATSATFDLAWSIERVS